MNIGDTAWYLYRYSGNGMTYQKPVTVVCVKGERAKVRSENGRESWVKIKNLRRTN